MKRILLLMITAIILTACTNEKVDKPEQEYVEAEVIYERDQESVLVDNDDVKVELTKSRKESIENETDWMKLMFVITNKKERTYEFYFNEMKLDKTKHDFDSLTPSDVKLEPGEKLEVMLIVESENEINFEEYIAGEFVYVDFEENVYEEKFSKYINE